MNSKSKEVALFTTLKKSILIAAAVIVCHGYAAPAQNTVDIKILAINDFHGQITTGQKMLNRPVGGAAVLASHLESAQKRVGKQVYAR